MTLRMNKLIIVYIYWLMKFYNEKRISKRIPQLRGNNFRARSTREETSIKQSKNKLLF